MNKQFKHNNHFNKFYKFYNENLQDLEIVFVKLSNKYDIPFDIVKNALLKEIQMSFGDKSKERVFDKKCITKNFFKYYSVLIFIFFNSLLSLFTRKKVKRVDVFYEELWDKGSLYSRFYTYIDNYIGNYTKALLLTSVSNHKKTDSINIEKNIHEIVDIRRFNNYYDFQIAIKIIKNEFFYFLKLNKVTKKVNLDLITIYLKVLRKILIYSTQTKNIESKVIVAAADYYWNPLKYFIFKKKCGEVILLQHNYKVQKANHIQTLFIACDYFFAHSSKALDSFKYYEDDKKQKLIFNGLYAKERIAIGSIQLSPYVKEEYNKDIDILIIHQTVDHNFGITWKGLDQAELIRSYYKLLENLSNYLEENKNLNVFYIYKGIESCDTRDEKLIKKAEIILSGKNVKFTPAYGHKTFNLVSRTNIMINMYSSVGIEALGLNTKVLWVNYNNVCDIFSYEKYHEDIDTLIDDSYGYFKQKIDTLLENTKEVDGFYKQLKQRDMNIQESPAKIVGDKIHEITLGLNS